jgi:hypothetical protein
MRYVVGHVAHLRVEGWKGGRLEYTLKREANAWYSSPKLHGIISEKI